MKPSEYHHETPCAKSRFNTEREAADAIQVIKKSSSRGKIPQRSYWCASCKAWHLTSMSVKKKRPNKYTGGGFSSKAVPLRILQEALYWSKRKG